MLIKKIGLISIFVCLMTAELQAQDMAVPIAVQYPLFLKILSFDRSLKTRVGDELIFGIVYQEKFRNSLISKDQFVDAVKNSPDKRINDIKISHVPIEIDGMDLESAILKNGTDIDILYFTPMRAIDIKKLTDLSRKRKIMTMTGVIDFVEMGLAVGIGMKGKKPLIVINLSAAVSEGVDFDSRLLRLARVIDKAPDE